MRFDPFALKKLSFLEDHHHVSELILLFIYFNFQIFTDTSSITDGRRCGSWYAERERRFH